MRRTISFAGLWLVAGGAALALGSAGVAAVGNQVTGSRPSSLSASEVRDELAERAAGASTATFPTTTVAGPASTSIATSPSRGPSPSPSQPGSSGGAPSATTTTVAPAPVTRSYVVTGGSVTLRFAASGVTVQSATPNPGFSVEVEPEEGNGVEVEFQSADHRSRVKGWWDGGPRDEVREDDD